MVAGTTDALGRETLILPGSGISVVTENAFEALTQACRQFDLERLALHVSMFPAFRITQRAELEEAIRKEGADPKGYLRDYQLALILKVALGDRERESPGGRDPSPIDMMRLCRLLVASRSPADSDESDAAAVLVRTAYQQFWDLEGPEPFARGLIILNEVSELMPAEDRFELNEAFNELVGISFHEFVFLGFSLFALASQQPGRRFGVEQFTRSADFDIDAQTVERFLNLISLEIPEYREKVYDSSVWINGYDLYNLNPLVRWPAFRHSDGGVYVPIPRLLLDRVTKGIYYDLLPSLPRNARGRFTNFWGNAFDRYIGKLLQATPNFPPLTRGQDLVPAGKAADWIATGAERRIALECKTRGLSLPAKVTGEEQAVRDDIAKRDGLGLPAGLVQLAETVAALDDRPTECLLVTWDELYLANDERISILDALRRAAMEMTSAPLPFVHIVSASDVEALAQASEYGNHDAFTILERKRASDDSKAIDLRGYIRRNFPAGNKPIAIHREFLDRGFKQIVEPFRR